MSPSIWEPKNNYKAFEDFKKRTQNPSPNDYTLSFLDRGTIQWAKNQLYELEEKINKKPSILEVGCGYGRWSAALNGRYSNYTGIDIIKERVNYASKEYGKHNIMFRHIEPCKWNLKEQKFDAILSVCCLQHMKFQDVLDTLKLMSNHLDDTSIMLLHESRMNFITEAEANKLYLNNNCPDNMIYTPILLIQEKMPELKWTLFKCSKKFHNNFVVKKCKN